MDLTSRDVNEKQFHDAWRGYNQEEVDDFLDRVSESLERLHRENKQLLQRISELDHAVSASRNTEEMLKKTLVTAQRAAEEAIATAKAKAEELIGEAELRSRRAEADARRRSEVAEKEHLERKRSLEESLERLQRFEAELKDRLTRFLDQQKGALATLGSKAIPQPQPRPTPAPGQRQDTPVPVPQEQPAATGRSFSWRPDRSGG